MAVFPQMHPTHPLVPMAIARAVGATAVVATTTVVAATKADAATTTASAGTDSNRVVCDATVVETAITTTAAMAVVETAAYNATTPLPAVRHAGTKDPMEAGMPNVPNV